MKSDTEKSVSGLIVRSIGISREHVFDRMVDRIRIFARCYDADNIANRHGNLFEKVVVSFDVDVDDECRFADHFVDFLNGLQAIKDKPYFIRESVDVYSLYGNRNKEGMEK